MPVFTAHTVENASGGMRSQGRLVCDVQKASTLALRPLGHGAQVWPVAVTQWALA